jgi:hypothetical protein
MVPITMPSAIAIRMYCVNLLDILAPPVFPALQVWQISLGTQQACGILHTCQDVPIVASAHSD